METSPLEIAVTFPLDESTKAMDVSLDDHVPPVSPSVERVVVLPTISVLVPEIVPGFSGAQVIATSKLYQLLSKKQLLMFSPQKSRRQ